MPPPTQNPCRVCACWANAEVASRAVSIAQNAVARSVPISPLEVGERAAVAGVTPWGSARGCGGKLQTNFAVVGNCLWNIREGTRPQPSNEVGQNFLVRFAEPSRWLRYFGSLPSPEVVADRQPHRWIAALEGERKLHQRSDRPVVGHEADAGLD